MIEHSAFNIVAYPPEDICQKAIEVSRALKDKGGLFALDGAEYFPHITIVMQELPLGNIDRAKEALRDYAATIKPFFIQSLGYRQNDRGYANVEFEKSQLVHLQKEIIECINPLREGLLRESDKEYTKECSELEANTIESYGHRFVGENYSPHITFTKFEIRNDQAFIGIDEIDFSFEVARFGLFHLGEYGTCRKLVDFFDLSK